MPLSGDVKGAPCLKGVYHSVAHLYRRRRAQPNSQACMSGVSALPTWSHNMIVRGPKPPRCIKEEQVAPAQLKKRKVGWMSRTPRNLLKWNRCRRFKTRQLRSACRGLGVLGLPGSRFRGTARNHPPACPAPK